MTAQLFDLITIHCFWSQCRKVVREIDPLTASRVMQAHYDAEHGVDLVRLGYGNADQG